MASDSWLYLTYGIGLFFLTLKSEYVQDRHYLRLAWMNYVCAIFVIPLFSLIKAVSLTILRMERGELNIAKELSLADILASGSSWALVGISLLYFIAAVLPSDEEPPSIKNKANSNLFGSD